MTDAERLSEAFKDRAPIFILRALDQFAVPDRDGDPPKQSCGLNGWLWRLSDGSRVVLSDGFLLPLHSPRPVL